MQDLEACSHCRNLAALGCGPDHLSRLTRCPDVSSNNAIITAMGSSLRCQGGTWRARLRVGELVAIRRQRVEMRLGRPSCSGSPFLTDWTGCAGWIGGVVSRASACSLAALDQLPAADRRKLVGKKGKAGAFFFSFGRRASAVVTCQQPVPAFRPTFLIRVQLPFGCPRL